MNNARFDIAEALTNSPAPAYEASRKMRPCIFILGTRAQLVKVAPVLRRAVEVGLPHSVWFTGQHQESIEELISDFKLASLFVMPEIHKERSSIGQLITWVPRMLHECRSYLKKQSKKANTAPLVVVHGDTLSTFLGALAAKLSKGDVVHLESGLTSKSLLDPFPEELLRRLTFPLTRYALCPNTMSTRIMQRFKGCEVVETFENTLLDSVRFALAEGAGTANHNSGSYFVASLHRFQNLYPTSRLTDLVAELLEISRIGKLYFMLHPPTKRRLQETGLITRLEAMSSINLQPRLPYTRFLALIAGSRGVFTDGGSNQEELSYLGVPTVLFRSRSERPDGLGQNVSLLEELNQPLPNFLRSGGLDKLRRPRQIDNDVQPTSITVQALLRWADTENV